MNGYHQKYFSVDRVLQLFCHNLEGAHYITCSQKQLELKSCPFQRLRSFSLEAATGVVLQKKMLSKNLQYSQENPCTRIFATLFKKRLWCRVFPVIFAKFLRTPFFRNISERLLIFYNSFWLYTSQLYIAGNQGDKEKGFFVGARKFI